MSKLKNKVIRDVSSDKFELEYNLCEKIKFDLNTVISDYFKIVSQTSVVAIQMKKDSNVLFNFSCVIEDINKCNF